MRQVRFTGSPAGELRRPLFDLLASGEWVRETRLVDWTLGTDCPAALFIVRGDSVRFEAALAGVPDVQSYEVQHADADRFALYVTLDTPEPLTTLFDALTTSGLVVVGPVIYRDGCVRGSLVGQAADIRSAFDSFPDSLSLTIESVTEFDVGREFPAATLTDRQLTVVRTAAKMGYYEIPRETTHGAIAAALDCAASTVSEHLHRAEAKLVTGALDVYE
ncbi:DNA-binding protein [Halogeometricum borinquense]|uniref:DNA-binding protein n=1 Tax=Halogeometricum borinquense TaxID=60847 RepID=A0A6C0UHR3_9EURY|nr:helix-turn-helix domain-containing protein [Halogeometricum borinquense]QIB74747.1 DNA-binding protein [Halogeometricum borinquense]QIQ76298.1 DNA-binding protein [Halogeometricum borinquense]